ncbi:receptor-type tyrosine-protein phosphatase mu-like [Argopecten irradians]|uniref:receptor-type tyrosine-protein phosphatase mu-like n=1 Tax=Argopecten irradians TaxID=31199 RepID=UPI003715D641
MIGYKLIVSNTETKIRWGRNRVITGHICHDETRSNPPLDQSVPCLVRGRYITYADNVGTGDPYPYVELCDLEAYGCPTGWYGLNDCNVPCPIGCRDGVCNPDNGTCFSGCKIGLQGIACNESCDYGRFGMDCQQYCFCLSDTCNSETGSCPDGRCQKGWNGTACNQSCGLRTFGENCLETCNCLQGSCDPANGTCYQEGCQPGWQRESCSLECDDGRFGPGCDGTCGACRGGAPCDKVTGICPLDCADGWTTPACNESCPAGTFGYNCSSECFCRTGPCDPTNGICPGNACDRGWYGTTCSSQCEPGTFGYDCVEKCHCRVGSCNRTYGLCPTGGCRDGWQTDTCSKKCDRGTYGPGCSVLCGNCTGRESCHHINGHCPQGCEAGYHGDLCDKECDDFNYGINCQRTCHGCEAGKCQHIHGACLRGCVSGMTGERCDQEDISIMMTAIGAVAGFLFLLIIFGAVVAFLKYQRKRKLTAERFVEFTNTTSGTEAYCNVNITPEKHQISSKDRHTNISNGGTNQEVEKPIYDVANDGGNIYRNIGDVESMGSLASHLSQYLDETDEDIPENMDQSENVYTNFAVKASTQIKVSELTETIAFKKESGAFLEEYNNLPKGLQYPHESGKGPEKKVKNRFKDMLPYDHSRVVLNTLPGVKNSDYINASYIDSVTEERQYIASQGPKEATVWDFWRMIWEQNSGKIVMVTNVKEGIKQVKLKCHPYWPSRGETISNDLLSVTSTDEKRYLAFVVRTLIVMDTETEEKRSVHQFHFTTWPDHGVPNPFQLVQFHRAVEKQQTALSGPLVVHCSAGIGRTGTYIGLDALLKHSQVSSTIDVFQFTMKMRENRLNMIQTADQYQAVHEALDVSLSFPDTAIQKSQFETMDQDARNTRIQDEFQVLRDIKPSFTDTDYSIALSAANVSKNRSSTCVPTNRFRVRLKSPLDGRDDYINAVFFPSCSRSCGYIATQLPLVDTVLDFWTLVYDFNSQIIVLLDREETDAKFLPSADEPELEIGGFVLSLSDTNQAMGKAGEINVYIQKQDKEKRLVKVLKVPIKSDHTDHIAIPQLVDAVSSSIRLGLSHNGSILTVVCSDGITHCAQFCLLKAVTERMELDDTVDIFNAAREIQNRRPDTFMTLVCFGYFHILVSIR